MSVDVCQAGWGGSVAGGLNVDVVGIQVMLQGARSAPLKLLGAHGNGDNPSSIKKVLCFFRASSIFPASDSSVA